jgi:transposase
LGLIDGCDLVFLAKSKDGDYHQEMNSFVFLEWFENQLMPALKNPSLVVLDNVGHQTHHSEATYNLCSDFG